MPADAARGPRHVSAHRRHVAGRAQADAEWGPLGPEAVEQILACRRRGGRVVAVGTTSVRLLETAAADGTLKPFQRPDRLVHPPALPVSRRGRPVDEFPLPRTTLLVLVRTFGGDELIRRAYEEAIREQYRFYSYGDAMLIF